MKDIEVLCTFNFKMKSQNSDHDCIKHQWPYPNQDQDAKHQSVTSSILQSPKSGLEGNWSYWPYSNQEYDYKPKSGTSSILQWPKSGHMCSLLIEKPGRELKFVKWVYQRTVNISKSISRCQNQSGTFNFLKNPKFWLKRYGCSVHL